VSGRAIPVRGANIDTDRIVPARFLKAVTFAGLEQHVFADDRAAAANAGTPHPFDESRFVGASVLVVNRNFGCGSSREHAPQALYRWGIRVVIAESFAPIFADNSLAIGLACVSAEPEVVDALMGRIDADPQVVVAVDIDRAEVTTSAGDRWPLVIADATRRALLSGEWDGTGLLLADYEAVERVEARLPYLRATSRNA
jgi:3-isopropylmalate/(R)-2-methylmalate dehydratase small subunit